VSIGDSGNAAKPALSRRPSLEPYRDSLQSELNRQAANLIDAIAKHGISSLLSAQLATVESRLGEIGRMLTAKLEPEIPAFSNEEIHEFLRQKSQKFCDVLTGDPALARQELQKRIVKLVLTPRDTPDGPVLQVTGDIAMFVSDDVMLTNSLEGIGEHYIPFAISLAGLQLDPRASLKAVGNSMICQ
jgi:hypothetical protein